jgi:hypothetical protein
MNKALAVATCCMLVSLPAFGQSSIDSDRASSSSKRDVEQLIRELGDEMSGGGLRRGFGFLLRSGDATVAVRCDPRDTMKTCVEATTTLLEKARSSLPTAGATPGATPPK